MKKGLLSLLVVFLILGVTISVSSFTQNQAPKTFNIKLTTPQLQTLWYVIDKSGAEYTVVREIQSVISSQIEAQSKDTSTKKK